MAIYIIMLLGAAAIVALSYRYDLHDKEPLPLALAAVLAGMAAMALAGAIENWAFVELRLGPDQVARRAILVAVVEDVLKLIVVLGIARVFAKHFNDPLDGLIYGTLVGLGAAIDESLLYIRLSPGSLSTAGAEIIRLFAHALMGGLVGFGVGIGARPGGERTKRPGVLAGCVALTIAIHFAWDWIAYQPRLAESLRPLVIALMAMLFVAWGVMVVFAAKRSRQAFAV